MRFRQFWRRVTEGLEISQLWSQFESETKASYRLYSKDVQAKTPEGLNLDHAAIAHAVVLLEKLQPKKKKTRKK